MMNYSEIMNLIENPGLIKLANKEQLRELVKQYPYFQTAHILFLKALKDSNLEDFQEQLEKSSIHISDRDLLFNFLNREFESVKLNDPVAQLDKKEEQTPGKHKNKTLLKNKDVRRKINDSSEGMGANISETLASQIEFSSVKNNTKLEYPSEIYFMEEERDGKNNIITIEAEPDSSEKDKEKDILDIEGNQSIEEKHVDENNSKEAFELLDSDAEVEERVPGQKDQSGAFDIRSYAGEDDIELKDDLISKFIEKNPRIKPKKIEESETADISQDSIKEDSNLLSETLIKVYIKQGLYGKAIESYQKLSLKYPEKSAYFASQIKILEDKINN